MLGYGLLLSILIFAAEFFYSRFADVSSVRLKLNGAFDMTQHIIGFTFFILSLVGVGLSCYFFMVNSTHCPNTFHKYQFSICECDLHLSEHYTKEKVDYFWEDYWQYYDSVVKYERELGYLCYLLNKQPERKGGNFKGYYRMQIRF